MAVITQTIGTASRNFSTIQAWEDALPANLVTDGNSYVGQLFNDSQFTIAGSSTAVTIAGETTDSTHTITLTTGAGQSFRDNAGVQTNPLRYDQSKGVGLLLGTYDDGIISNANFVTISNLQIKTATNSYSAIKLLGNNSVLENSIIVSLSGASAFFFGSNSGTGQNSIVRNCLYITKDTQGVRFGNCGALTLANCTIVHPSDASAIGTGNGLYTASGGHYAGVNKVVNCAVFGFANFTDDVNNFGTVNNNNCTDKSTVVVTGSGNLVSKTYANQFVNLTTASADYRIKAGADLIDAGATDTTDVPAAVDIAGTSRPSGASWDIGAWELLQVQFSGTQAGSKQRGVLRAFSQGLDNLHLRQTPRGPVKIDWSHPLATGMTDCLVWQGGPPNNLAAPSVNTTITLSPTDVMTVAGPAGYSTGGSGYNIPNHGNIAAGDFAVRVLFYPVSWPGSFTTLIDKGTGGNLRELCFMFNASGNIGYYEIGKSSGTYGGAIGATAGSIWDFVVTRTGSTASFYLNGVLQGTATDSGILGNAVPLSFGPNSSGGGGTNGNTQYLTSQIWNRGLSAGEVAQLASDPYAFLIPAEGEMPALSAAAPVLVSNDRPSAGKKTGVLQAYPGGLSLGRVPRGRPKIDWSHPLARGLIACYLPGVTGGRDLAGRTDLTITAGGFFDTGPEGPVLNSLNTGSLGAAYSGAIPTGSPLLFSDTFSMYWRGILPAGKSTGTVGDLFAIKLDNTEAQSGAGWQYPSSTSGSVGIKTYWAIGTSQPNLSTNTLTDGVVHSITNTFAVTADAVLSYTDGALVNTSQYFGPPGPTWGTGPLICLMGNQAASRPCGFATHIATIYNRVLSASEVAALDADPYCFLVPAEGEMPALGGAAPAVPTGTLNTTEAKDTAAFNATFAITGTLATTETQDVAAFTATYAVTGTLNTTEAQDVAAFNATFAITGTLNTTEAKDTAAFNATFAITGTLATTEGQDVAAFTGTGVTPTGTLVTVEAPDTAAFTGTAGVAGTLATTEAPDTANFTGTVGGVPSGILATTETRDIASISGVIVQAPSSGYLAATEAQDIVYIVGPGLVPLDPVGVLNFGRRVVINRW